MSGEVDPRFLDARLAARAARQHGVVHRRDALADGATRDQIALRLEVGRLHEIHRSVYAVGHRKLTREGRWMAAVLATGQGAALGHRSAGALIGLRRQPPGPIHVITRSRTGRANRTAPVGDVAGIVVHRAPTLHQQDVVVIDGIPCTTVARTIVDIAATASRRELEKLLDEAAHLEVLNLRAIEEVLARIARPRGVRQLRAVLAEHDAGSTRTQSELEERFLLICVTFGVPLPRTQVPVALGDGRYAYVDALYAAEGVVVELDGPDHDRPGRARYDAWRDGRLRDRGLVVLRFGEDHLEDGAEVARTVLGTLHARRGASWAA